MLTSSSPVVTDTPRTERHALPPAPEPARIPPRARTLRDESGTRGHVTTRCAAVNSMLARYALPAWEHPLANNTYPCRRGVLGRSKRVMDIAIASAAIVFLLPLWIATAVAIKLDSPGPVFFRQERNGAHLRIFKIYKFRTMRTMEDGASVRQASADDQRVTRVGRFLRASSLDELPQLFNVLKGEMSIVGPRPHALLHDAEYSDVVRQYALRFRARPGLTGLAQIRGLRGPIHSAECIAQRIRADLEYQHRWSLAFDLWIILATPLCLASHCLSRRAF